MLHLIQSNKMEVLAEALCRELSNDTSGPMQPRTILVQSPGMAQWLRVNIASSLGVAANLNFPLPSSFIWSLYQRCLSDVPEQTAFSKPAMQWKLLSLFEQLQENPAFNKIHRYLDKQDDDFRAYQLAAKIADVYDQYLMFRPDWLAHWELQQPIAEIEHLEDQEWQMMLWNLLVERTEQLQQSTQHRSILHEQLLAYLQADNISLPLPKSIRVFGISALPPQHLEILNALAKHTEVLIFWFNPSQHYWGDLVEQKQIARIQMQQLQEHAYLYEVGNPLLAANGKLGRDFLEQLLHLEPNTIDLFDDSAPSKLLGFIQADIFELQNRIAVNAPWESSLPAPIGVLDQKDESVHFHACHSLVRELEVLQNQILYWIDTYQLDPGDVIVMMPDVAEYAPYIDAIFGNSHEGLRVPYAISDRQAKDESPFISCFLTILNINQSRFGLNEILDVLAVPALQRRFGLSQEEYRDLHHWLTEAGVRWGLDGDDKARWQLPTEKQNTWWFGLRRLLLGYAMDSEAILQFDSMKMKLTPYTDIEGQGVTALGKLSEFLEALEQFYLQSLANQALTEHVEQANQLTESFFEIDEQDEAYQLTLQNALAELLEQQENLTVTISRSVFTDALQAQLQDKGVGQRFLAGKVNFCTLMPMRSVPFEAVCLLGMNDGEYPRQVKPVGFDLLHQAPKRKGDRSRRLDDRYLFLEALMSARRFLHVSYLGLHIRDNSELNPSSVVSELMEYCLNGFELEVDANQAEGGVELKQQLITSHPLQPFDEAYFIEPKSYQSHWLKVAKRLQMPQINDVTAVELPPSTQLQNHFALSDFIDVLVNPIRFFLRSRWQVSLPTVKEVTEQTEPVEISGLENYHLTHWLVEKQLTQPQLQADLLYQQLSASGELPLQNMGKETFRQLHDSALEFCARINTQVSDVTKNQSVSVDWYGKELAVTGMQHAVFDQKLVLWHVGKLSGRTRLKLWVEWLMLCQQKTAVTAAVLVCKDKTIHYAPLSQEYAHRQLLNLEQVVNRAQQQILPFFPKTAETWLTSESQVKALKIFNGDNHVIGEGQAPHIQQICPDLMLYWTPFCQLAEQILRPAIEWEGAI